MIKSVACRVKKSDILLTALEATKDVGLLDTKLIDSGVEQAYTIEWFALLEESRTLELNASSIVSKMQLAHLDCDITYNLHLCESGGVNLSVYVLLPELLFENYNFVQVCNRDSFSSESL